MRDISSKRYTFCHPAEGETFEGILEGAFMTRHGVNFNLLLDDEMKVESRGEFIETRKVAIHERAGLRPLRAIKIGSKVSILFIDETETGTGDQTMKNYKLETDDAGTGPLIASTLPENA